MRDKQTNQKYIEIIKKMSGEERIKAAQVLHTWARELTAASIREKNPNLNEKELGKIINQKFYSYAGR